MWQAKFEYAQRNNNIYQFGIMCLWAGQMFARRFDDPWTGGRLIDSTTRETRSKSLQEKTFLPHFVKDSWLAWCGLFGSPELLKDLLDEGQDVFASRDKMGRTSLHNASVTGNTEAVMVLLRAAGGRRQELVNQANENSVGFTPLIRAAQNGHVGVVHMLLDALADPNMRRADNGRAALHQAAFHGHIESVKLILGARADIRLGDQMGRTALHMTAGASNPFCSSAGRGQVAKLLLESGFSEDEPDFEGISPLELARKESNHAFISLCVPGSHAGYFAVD